MIVQGGLRILEKIERVDYDVVASPPDARPRRRARDGDARALTMRPRVRARTAGLVPTPSVQSADDA